MTESLRLLLGAEIFEQAGEADFELVVIFQFAFLVLDCPRCQVSDLVMKSVKQKDLIERCVKDGAGKVFVWTKESAEVTVRDN